MLRYKEPQKAGNPYRKDYLEGLDLYVERSRAIANQTRKDFAKDILDKGDAYRIAFYAMLGAPLTQPRETDIKMEKIFAAQDVHVYVPQFLLWDPNKFEVRAPEYVKSIDGIRRKRDVQLKQLGSSITAIEIYGLQCALDALENETYINKEQIGMAGLSYGDFYTLFAAAAEPRIKYSVACCQFSDRYVYGWDDWVWFDAANKSSSIPHHPLSTAVMLRAGKSSNEAPGIGIDIRHTRLRRTQDRYKAQQAAQNQSYTKRNVPRGTFLFLVS